MKPIKITDELRSKMLEEFQTYLTDTKFAGADISFKRDFSKLLGMEDFVKPVVLCTTVAWLKMQTLVAGTTDEIGWHGLVTRKDNVFLLTDIILYPQIVASTTVTTDTAAYGKWCCDLTPEECNHVRFQGHSHVNMPCNPSGVDMAYYSDLLSTLRNDEYYIFMVLNKRHEFQLLLYDLATNALYETKDIVWAVVDNKHRSIVRWAEEAMKAFCTRPTAPATYYSNNKAVGNEKKEDKRSLIWAFNANGAQIQMEERWITHCLGCGAANAQVRTTCGKCGDRIYGEQMG